MIIRSQDSMESKAIFLGGGLNWIRSWGFTVL